ncbi:MAG: GNAT family N-acetyltransferase [Acidimicrobiales bacterium]
MVEVRLITEDEIPAYLEAERAGFHRNLRGGEADYYRAQIDPTRTYAAFDDGRVVGTARSFPTELTLPGAVTVGVAGVTNVTVTATHRRRGLLTEMMRQQLDELAGRGEPLAILIASEAPIYGRFGYGPATEHAWMSVDVPQVRFTTAPTAGSVWRCTPTELFKEGPAVYDRFRLGQSGAIERPEWWWERRFVNLPPDFDPPKGERFNVLHRDVEGEADGFACYRIRGDWDYRVSNSVLEVDDLVAATDDAYIALWRHCTEVDWIKRVDAYNRPPVEPLPWMLADPRAAVQKARADLVWVRLVDVIVALAARRYRVADRIVIEVPEAGTLALDGGPDGASCAGTKAAADVSVPLADLGAAFLGGTPLWPALVAGRVVEHRRGAVAAFDLMFGSDAPPWCNTWF